MLEDAKANSLLKQGRREENPAGHLGTGRTWHCLGLAACVLVNFVWKKGC